ncbi:MAG TPA: iron-sulfur cluster assembly protein, partial [Candidatus Binatia bacterium]|nr:iron-sulfur cluster assembly protein [Candidatus Binatia bacterium]
MTNEQEEKKTEHTSGAAGAAGNGHSVAAGTPETSGHSEARHVPLPDVVVEHATAEAADPQPVPDVATPASDSAAAAESAAKGSASTAGEEAAPLDIAKTEQLLIEAMHTVFDPEIPVDIYELGLIYDLRIREDGHVDIKMTLTTPNCP